MKKLYEKNELAFALVWIVMFVSVLNRSYECEYCYYSTNSEV